MMEDPKQRAMFEQFGAELRERFSRSVGRLVEILTATMGARQKDVATAEEARRRLQELATHYWETREGWVQAGTTS